MQSANGARRRHAAASCGMTGNFLRLVRLSGCEDLAAMAVATGSRRRLDWIRFTALLKRHPPPAVRIVHRYTTASGARLLPVRLRRGAVQMPRKPHAPIGWGDKLVQRSAYPLSSAMHGFVRFMTFIGTERTRNSYEQNYHIRTSSTNCTHAD
jgi:hypothetical protein